MLSLESQEFHNIKNSFKKSSAFAGIDKLIKT